jgi:protocatechuate 3,4-dioxygenase beta subunit
MRDLFDLGLPADLRMWLAPMDRRRLLKLGALSLGTYLTGCSSDDTGTGGDACLEVVPEETAGPYPADGSQQDINVLERSGIVRSDIRTSLDTGNTAQGVPITIELQLVNTEADCEPLAGYAVYLWHCNRDGEYSLYSAAVVEEDYLRGVQETDSEGKVTFTSIFPACYSGRWPHIHFEVYPDLASATDAANKIHTSQIALPADVCATVYGSATGYAQSVQNLSQVSLATDNVFGEDEGELQLAAVTGSVGAGYTITLTAGLAEG